MKPISITHAQARRLAIGAQLLNGRLSPTKAAILTTFQQLGCIQIDPINVVARNPLLVLWSRIGQFDVADFEALLWQDKALFEYWAHAASIVLTDDFPLHQPRMQQMFTDDGRWAAHTREWMATNDSFRHYVLHELETQGALFSKEFEDRAVTENSGGVWASGRQVGKMLGLLWQQGTITVAQRQGDGFGLQKQWSLTSRHLPQWTDHEAWSSREVVALAAQKALRALGVGTAKHIENHFIRERYPDLDVVLAELVENGRLHPIIVENQQDDWYIHDDTLNNMGELMEARETAVLLSPFDNLICDRTRTETLFNFYYRSEIYTPKAKRKYGYYVMPILYNDRLIGRLDPKMDRKTRTLHINAIFTEPDVLLTDEMGTAVYETIARLATFLNADKIAYGGRVPSEWATILQN